MCTQYINLLQTFETAGVHTTFSTTSRQFKRFKSFNEKERNSRNADKTLHLNFAQQKNM